MLNRGSYSDAAKKFEDLDRDHPYAPEARRAMVMAAYAYYKAGKYPEAIVAGKRYTTMHPGTKDAALAHHIIASANFDEIRGAAPRPDRDPQGAAGAQAAGAALSGQSLRPAGDQPHPHCRGHSGGIGNERRPVLSRQARTTWAPSTASRRWWPSTRRRAQVEEALYRIVEANMTLGIVPEAQAAGAVLGHNFPNSDWYKRALQPAEERAA